MEGFQTPDGKKRSQAVKSDSALDGAADGGWDFLVGTAISVYQNSGGDNNNWWRYERQRTRLGRPTIDVSTLFCMCFLRRCLVAGCILRSGSLHPPCPSMPPTEARVT